MIFLAIKHLTKRKKQTIFTILGVFMGSIAFVVISGFFGGFKLFMTNSLVAGDAHIKITQNDEKLDPTYIKETLKPKGVLAKWVREPNPRIDLQEIKNVSGWINRLENDSQVKAVGKQYSTTGVAKNAGVSLSVSVIGVQPEKQVLITNIGEKIVQGNIVDIGRGNDRVAIGVSLSEELSVGMGDTLRITASDGQIYGLKIVAVFDMGNANANKTNVYTSVSSAQRIGNENGKINQISVRIDDYQSAAALATQWKSRSRDKVESWDQANSNTLSIFVLQDFMRYLIIAIILLVAAFGIYNILNMVVSQKRKDIAILRSMGFDENDILKLFLFQGVFLGIVGSILGVFFGYLVCLYLQTLSFGPSGKLTIAFGASIYLTALGLGVFVSALASYLPSRAASKLTPIDIIRSGGE